MRFFNTEGPIRPDDHYHVPPLDRVNLDDLLGLVRDKRYFVLHAPRQTGKTSALLALRDLLNGGGDTHASPHFASHQITPKTSRYTRCSMSMLPNVAINGRTRSSGQLGRWWYSISPCRNNECVRRFTVFAFNQRS